MRERVEQIRGGDGVVDDERHAVAMCNLRDALDVEDLVVRVGDRLAVERARVVADCGLPRVEIFRILDERDLDAELGQRVVEEVVSSAVEAGTRHDVPAVLDDVEDRVRLRSLARRDEQRRDTALESSETLLDDILCRVHQARVDVAWLGKAEQIRGMGGVVERVRRGLVDRQSAGVGRRVGCLACVNLLGLETPVVGWILVDVDVRH